MFEVLTSAPSDCLDLLLSALVPGRLKDFAVAAHAFARFWPSRRRLLSRQLKEPTANVSSESCFNPRAALMPTIFIQALAALLCCAARDAHADFLPAVASTLAFLFLSSELRASMIRSGIISTLCARYSQDKSGASRSILCSLLWGEASTSKGARRINKPKVLLQSETIEDPLSIGTPYQDQVRQPSAALAHRPIATQMHSDSRN